MTYNVSSGTLNHTIPYRTVSSNIFEIKSKKANISHPLPFNVHGHVEPWNYSQNFNTKWPSPYAIRRCKNIAEKFRSCVGCSNVTDDKQTDRRTDRRTADAISRT